MYSTLTALVSEYDSLFLELKGLPPPREQDHYVVVQLGIKLASFNPYRYPYFHKSKIEKLVQEMLESGIIQPSHSHYSSPVLLVRKQDGS